MAIAGGPKPIQILTAQAFDNAIRADMAIGGSTNAIIHLVALAGRVGVPLPLHALRRALAHHAVPGQPAARPAST